MNNKGSIGATTIPLLSSFILIGAASSTMFGNPDDISADVERIVNDALDEITTYLKIEDVMGKYYNNDGIYRIEKIVVLVRQIIQSTVNMSDVTIKIRNKNDVKFLKYSGYAVESDSEVIFENKIWDKTNNAFSLIVIHDKDRSVLDYNIMNKDTVFIAIKLPDQFTMKNDESISLSIIPSKGITTSIILETPSFHSSNIISFGEV